MGLGHNIETILDAAMKLKDNSQIQFEFIGSGPKYKIVEDYIDEHQTNNILLLPLQPDDIFPFSMACGDVGIVTQESSMAHLFMPSKTFSLMTCGQAILGVCSQNDDLKNLIVEKKIGEYISDSDSSHLSKIIKDLFYDKNKIEQYKRNYFRNEAGLYFDGEIAEMSSILESEI